VSIAGGSTAFQISSTTTYAGLAVSVDGVDGYFELTGVTPGSGNTVTIFVTIGQNAPQTFSLQVAAGAGTTSYGTAQAIPVQLTAAGTGDVQINVSWDVDTDVDLHAVEPGGMEIYYNNKGPTAAGGKLDLDSNPNCVLDHRRSENISWPSGRAPRGTYVVRVALFSACTPPIARTNYLVTVNVKGQQPQFFNGFFVPADTDSGTTGSGRAITTFTY
jgi:hypothetical protein